MAILIDKWKKDAPADNFFFRPNTSEDRLLFCYQTEWQSRLLALYGNITLLDATYKTTRYTTPLFFLWVRTNVRYAVVGVFVTTGETNAHIEEGLRVFKDWNPAWKPSSFMVDFSKAEINALEAVWPGSYNS